LLLLGAFPACRTFDDARVLQALNQRGFGRKYVGDANEVLTVGIGDSFTIGDVNNPDIVGNFTVRLDGAITVPLIGEVFVAGFTTDEIASALELRFREYFTTPRIQVELVAITSKRYFLRGEVLTQGEQILTKDTTVWDAVMGTGVPITADISDIYVVRADPRYPLIIPVDLGKMLRHGDSRDNILLREDDIVVVRPNLAGWIRRGVELLLAPIAPLTQLGLSLETLDELGDDNDDRFRGGRGFGYGGNLGGSVSTFDQNNPVVTPPGGS
ncbi:MAG: polysaccharide biosynthesis/export family protein, partial [Planctomycetota bacterium JB042]